MASMQPFVTITCESACQATLAGVSNVLCSPTISSDLIAFLTNSSARRANITVQQGLDAVTTLLGTVNLTLVSYAPLIDQVMTQIGVSSTNATLIIRQIQAALGQAGSFITSMVTTAMAGSTNATIDPARILQDIDLIVSLINSTGLITNTTQFNMIIGQLQQYGALIAQGLASSNLTAMQPSDILATLDNISKFEMGNRHFNQKKLVNKTLKSHKMQ